MTFRHLRRASLCVGLLLLSTACTDLKLGPEPEPEPEPAPSRPPNVHFLIDTSGSMRELPQVVNSDHQEFFNITVNGCSNPRLDAFSNSQGWVSAIVYLRPDRGTGHGADHGFPDLFRDDKFYAYMSWGNSNAPPPQWSSREEACQSQVVDWSGAGATEYSRCLSCLDTKGYYKTPWAEADPSLPTNYDFILWGRFLNFNPPKYVTLRAALKRTLDALGGPELGGVRVGFSSFINSPTASTMGERLNPICAQSSADPSSFEPFRARYINAINGLSFTTGTPLARALLNAGYYFTSGDDVYKDAFGFGLSYGYPSAFRNDALTSPQRSVCWGCQTSAIILVTDGEPTGDSLPAPIASQLRTLNGGPVYCPDSQPCGLVSGSPRDKGTNPDDVSDDNPNYLLDDVAMLLANQDLQRASPEVVGDFDTSGFQHLRIYTVGFGIDSPLLANTARVGNGLYLTASTGSQLEQALKQLLTDVKSRAASCTVPQ
jgi:type IV pilus assembly protein PilY1